MVSRPVGHIARPGRVSFIKFAQVPPDSLYAALSPSRIVSDIERLEVDFAMQANAGDLPGNGEGGIV